MFPTLGNDHPDAYQHQCDWYPPHERDVLTVLGEACREHIGRWNYLRVTFSIMEKLCGLMAALCPLQSNLQMGARFHLLEVVEFHAQRYTKPLDLIISQIEQPFSFGHFLFHCPNLRMLDIPHRRLHRLGKHD
ncbi:hypothetical protein BT96DRAFT_72566 [Gymnopus androsaceus JB14]|uniref:Uncharacterized protein n=1 Tax=Gymnopus androsaceus JB14 TaxID=1447944 RepID=A0A6A4HHN7_9AGAR|nr:hypothetical protein BT96DRAFT_72566 [Gymnopus androsaceus JB14]